MGLYVLALITMSGAMIGLPWLSKWLNPLVMLIGVLAVGFLPAALGLTDVIDQVFITHVHADHISGVVSLIWYYMLTGRKRELLIAGPQGLRNTVLSLMEAMGTPLDRVEPWLRFRELKAGERIGCALTARALHTVPSLAYRIDLERAICYTGGYLPYGGGDKTGQGL